MHFQQFWNRLLLWVGILFTPARDKQSARILKRQYGTFCAILCCERDTPSAVDAATWRIVPRRGDFHLLITADSIAYKEMRLKSADGIDYASVAPSHRITISLIAVSRPKISLHKLFCGDVDLQGVYLLTPSDRLARIVAESLAQAILKFDPHNYEISNISEKLAAKLFALYGNSNLNYEDLGLKWVVWLCQINWLKHIKEIAVGYLGKKHEV